MKESCKLCLLVLFVLVSLPLTAVIFTAKAGETGTVTATVTAQNISISVGLTAVSFGTIGVGSSADTTSNGVNTSITATNDGNITEKFNIQAGDSTNWTMAVSPGSEKFTMKNCTSGCDVSPTWNPVGIGSSAAYETLAASVAASGNQEFDLQIRTPTSTTNYTEQSISVVVQATTP